MYFYMQTYIHTCIRIQIGTLSLRTFAHTKRKGGII